MDDWYKCVKKLKNSSVGIRGLRQNDERHPKIMCPDTE